MKLRDPITNATIIWASIISSALSIVALILSILAMSVNVHAAEQQTCFPSASWNARQGDRPCVSVRVFEDGSFEYRVTDADGTHRYGGNVGAKDR